jgi:hypothetical protein
MDAELKRFKKSFELHSSRATLYDSEVLEKGSVGRNNRATNALWNLKDRVIANPDKYKDLLLEYLDGEDSKLKYRAAVMCLFAKICPEKAINIIKEICQTVGTAALVRIDSAFLLGMYKRGTL